MSDDSGHPFSLSEESNAAQTGEVTPLEPNPFLDLDFSLWESEESFQPPITHDLDMSDAHTANQGWAIPEETHLEENDSESFSIP